jgi:CheY-like chemotaxis protein
MDIGKNILIVEDEQELLEIISMVLKKKGHNIYTASNGKNALDIIESKKVDFDLILSDIVMPQMSGIQLLDEIKKKLPYKPIVALTTGHTNTNIEDIYAKGAVSLLRKPFHLEDLSRMVQEILDTQNAGNPSEIKGRIDLEFKSIDDPDIKIGQRGAFLRDYVASYPVNTYVEFDIKFSKGDIKDLKGTAEIVWVRPSPAENLSKGTGVRFVNISKEVQNYISNYVGKNKIISTIPKN